MQPALDPERPNDEVVLLKDDRRVTIRSITREDGSALTDFYARLSPDARVQRFFHFHPVTPAEGQRLAAIQDEGGVALVAVNDDRAIVADARCVRRPDAAADLAIAVSDDYQGFGLGTMLFDRLVAAAESIGMTTIVAQLLGHNLPMKRLLSKRHFTIIGRDGSSMVEASFRNDGRVPTWSADTRQPRVLVEDGSWYGSMHERQLRDAGFSVAMCPGSPPGGSCELLATGSCRLAEGADVIISSASDEESRDILAIHGAMRPATPLFVAVGPEQAPTTQRAKAISRSATPQELLDALKAEGVCPPDDADLAKE